MNNFRKFLGILIICCSVGLAQADEWKDESGKGKSKGYYEEKNWQKDRDKD